MPADAQPMDTEYTPVDKPLKRNGTVDGGWGSRALIVGTMVGVFMMVLATFVMLVAITGWWRADLPDLAQGALAQFDARTWLYAVIAGATLVGAALGLIRIDKVIDLARDALPVLKAKYLGKPQ